jgi:hypothetical protein
MVNDSFGAETTLTAYCSEGCSNNGERLPLRVVDDEAPVRHLRTLILEHNAAEAVLFWSSLRAESWCMERTFEADTREQANRRADEWWAKAKGLRFIHRSQIPPGFRSNPHKRWVIRIHYKEEGSSHRAHRPNGHAKTRVVC